MDWPLFVLGIALLLAAVVDILWTTLWVGGGSGPLSSVLMGGAWRGLKAIARAESRVLSLAGPLLVMLTFVMWIGLLWAGWTFVFAGGESAIVDTRNPDPISWSDRLYFVAYSLFTLGIGDFVPREGAWQIATIFTTATGMLFITLGVSYVVSIIGAVSRKRSFASSVTAIGASGEEFVRMGWNGENFDGFDLTLNALATEIDALAYQYKAYPILHYYHTRDGSHATAVGVAIFDEALTLLSFGVPEEDRPNTALVQNARSSTHNFMETLSEAFIDPAEEAPPAPDLERLREADIPAVSDEEFDDALGTLDERRRYLLGMIRADVRDWPAENERDQ